MVLRKRAQRTPHRRSGELPEAEQLDGRSNALSKFAVVSFCVSFLSWIFPVGLVALALNVGALLRVRMSKGRFRGTGYATAGIVVSVTGIVLVIVPQLSTMSKWVNRSLVMKNMNAVQVAVDDWRRLSQGRYPLSPTDRTPATNQTVLDLLPRELGNPYSKDRPGEEILVFKPWPPATPIDSIPIPPGMIYIYCSKERYVIIGGAESSRPMDLVLSSEQPP